MDAIEQANLRKWLGIFLVGGAILGVAYLVKARSAKINPLSIVRIEPANELNPNRKDIVHLKDGTTVEDIGYDLEALGSYSDDETFAALMFTGKNCQDCDEQEKFYVYSTSDSRNHQFELPGRVMAAPKEGETEGELLSYTRMFYGSCLSDMGNVLLTTKEEKLGVEVKYNASIWGFNSNHAFVELRREENQPVVEALLEDAKAHMGKKCRGVPEVERVIQP